ncbi:septum formation initiator family protein [Schaalia hyovaginalis]|uniref:FtsB family cell division protein n=1 Tax=Schaalia hyovaginalis TaxID=29316 RepID=UPI002A757522|nr:septum formation initiator family protein [Schaalia hyovaginalis]MDY2669632.1 septum formation initiator family protein [Schaalia hyovaginalis]
MASSPRNGRPHAPRRPAGQSDNARPAASGRTASSRRGGLSGGARASGGEPAGNAESSSSKRSAASGRTPSSSRSFASNRRARQTRARATTGPRQPKNRDQRERRDSAREQGRASRVRDGRTFVVGGLEISTRLLSVILLAGVLAVLLVPNLYAWWRQEQELRDITARVQAAQERNDEMKQELDLWQNPDYIASQARERLGYVKPGETQFTVVDPGEDYQDEAQIAAAQAQGPTRPWVQVVGILLKEADSPRESTPVPGADAGQSDGSG